MNIGIIGCGAISDQYMIGLNKNKEILKVVACADLDSNKSEVFSKKHKIDMLSVEEIFVNNDIDLIVNLTPPSSHFEISMKSLQNAKHVFSEKPVSLSIDEGKKYVYGDIEVSSNISEIDIDIIKIGLKIEEFCDGRRL